MLSLPWNIFLSFRHTSQTLSHLLTSPTVEISHSHHTSLLYTLSFINIYFSHLTSLPLTHPLPDTPLSHFPTTSQLSLKVPFSHTHLAHDPPITAFPHISHFTLTSSHLQNSSQISYTSAGCSFPHSQGPATLTLSLCHRSRKKAWTELIARAIRNRSTEKKILRQQNREHIVMLAAR